MAGMKLPDGEDRQPPNQPTGNYDQHRSVSVFILGNRDLVNIFDVSAMG